MAQSIAMTHSTNLLRQILVRAEEFGRKNQFCLVVFDLDSTLFDVSPRLQQILTDFAQNTDNQKKFPESCKTLQTVKMQKTDWGIKNALIRAGLDKHSEEFHKAIKAFWLKSFFSNEYIHYDKPYPGSIEYVNQLHNLGCHITYLTGRDTKRMEKGTIEVLKKHQFPFEHPKVELVMKPSESIEDASFKKNWFAKIPDNKYPQIWFFENEPLNVNEVREHHQHVEIIFFDSTHSGKAEAHNSLPKIFNYLMD